MDILGDYMSKKKIDLLLVESLARLGVRQQSIAKAISFSECGPSNAKGHNTALRSIGTWVCEF
jgi:hypothetical protein